MRARAPFAIIFGSLLLSACIPPSPSSPSRNPDPRIMGEPLDTMFDEAPVWEERPVAAPAAGFDGRHLVQPGDTGIAIARAYGVPWAKIVEANGLEEPFIIKVGQKLQIPGTGRSAAEVDTARAAAFRLEIDDIVTGGEPASDLRADVSVHAIRNTKLGSPTRLM